MRELFLHVRVVVRLEVTKKRIVRVKKEETRDYEMVFVTDHFDLKDFSIYWKTLLLLLLDCHFVVSVTFLLIHEVSWNEWLPIYP